MGLMKIERKPGRFGSLQIALTSDQDDCSQKGLRVCQNLFDQIDLSAVFIPVFKLELNPIPNCFVSTEVVES
jgi:hypothetical protein